MPEEIRVEGAAELAEVAARLRAAGAVELMKNMRRNIRVAVLPAKPAIRRNAMATLPSSGGLNEWVASATIGTRILTGPRNAGVLVRVSRKGHDMKDIDAGQVRHRVFGVWRAGVPTQQVTPGFATKPLRAMEPGIAAGCLIAMRETSAAAGFDE